MEYCYIHKVKGSINELCYQLNIDTSAAYRRRDLALHRFTQALYGPLRGCDTEPPNAHKPRSNRTCGRSRFPLFFSFNCFRSVGGQPKGAGESVAPQRVTGAHEKETDSAGYPQCNLWLTGLEKRIIAPGWQFGYDKGTLE